MTASGIVSRVGPSCREETWANGGDVWVVSGDELVANVEYEEPSTSDERFTSGCLVRGDKISPTESPAEGRVAGIFGVWLLGRGRGGRGGGLGLLCS